jgi:hypothetical protein
VREGAAGIGGWFDPWAVPGGVDPTGLEAAVVNGGGDIAVLGTPAPGQSWRIGIPGAPKREQMEPCAPPVGFQAAPGTFDSTRSVRG